MLQEIRVIGEISLKKIILKISDTDYSKNLMIYLREHNIPIASSCRGEEICKKCIVSNSVLSCSLTVREYLDKYGADVFVSYL